MNGYEKRPLHVPSLVLGLVAIATSWVTAGIHGIVCGAIGIVLARKAKYTHEATAGFVLSLIGLIISILTLVIGGLLLGALLRFGM